MQLKQQRIKKTVTARNCSEDLRDSDATYCNAFFFVKIIKSVGTRPTSLYSRQVKIISV